MEEEIQPDRLGVMDSAAGKGLPLTPAERLTGSTTAESKQHLNVETAEYKGKEEQQKEKSALGKVKEKAKKLKSRVKRGLKIGGSEENEQPSDEDSSLDSQEDDDEHQNAAGQQEATNAEKNPVDHTLEQAPEEAAPSISDLLEDGKKPITPFESDGPTHVLQAVPTQYRDYYRNPDNNCSIIDSGERKEEEQSHQASTKDGSDLSKSFLGAIDDDDQRPRGGASVAESGGVEGQVENSNWSQSADLGNEDGAIGKNDSDGDDGSKRGEETELEHRGSQNSASSSAHLNPHLGVAHSAALCKDEHQKPSFISEVQPEEDDADEESQHATGRALEGTVIPKFESALSDKENETGSGTPNSDMNPSDHGKQSDFPLENQKSEADDDIRIRQQEAPSSAASDEENNATPLSQRAFGGLSAAKGSLSDASSTVADAVGSSVGNYPHPHSAHEEQLPEAEKVSSHQKQDPDTNFHEDSSEGGGKESSWGGWLTDSIKPARELLGSTFGTSSPTEAGGKHARTDTQAETQNPLKDGDLEDQENW